MMGEGKQKGRGKTSDLRSKSGIGDGRKVTAIGELD
jgi:hypothetical protein